jgi:coenzyme Q-binding protein COQ10
MYHRPFLPTFTRFRTCYYGIGILLHRHHFHYHHQQGRRRFFFSFSNPNSSLIKNHTDTKIVPFSPEEMFDVVADVDQYKHFLPFCMDSQVLRRPNENVMEAKLKIGFHIFTESYTSRVIMKR